MYSIFIIMIKITKTIGKLKVVFEWTGAILTRIIYDGDKTPEILTIEGCQSLKEAQQYLSF